MRLRLIPDLLGDGTIWAVSVLNDIGSTTMSIFDTDLARLGEGFKSIISPAQPLYSGFKSTVAELGIPRSSAQMAPLTFVGHYCWRWSGWIEERAIVRIVHPKVSHASRVSLPATHPPPLLPLKNCVIPTHTPTKTPPRHLRYAEEHETSRDNKTPLRPSGETYRGILD